MNEFSIPRTSLLRLIKTHEKELKPHIQYGKRNRLEMNLAGKAILHKYIRKEFGSETVSDMTEHDQTVQKKYVEYKVNDIKKIFEDKLNY